MKVKGRLAKFGHFSAYLAVRFFVCLLQALPIETCRRIACGLAWLVTEVIGFRTALIDENLGRAFPNMSADTRAGWPARCGNTCF